MKPIAPSVPAPQPLETSQTFRKPHHADTHARRWAAHKHTLSHGPRARKRELLASIVHRWQSTSQSGRYRAFSLWKVVTHHKKQRFLESQIALWSVTHASTSCEVVLQRWSQHAVAKGWRKWYVVAGWLLGWLAGRPCRGVEYYAYSNTTLLGKPKVSVDHSRQDAHRSSA